jgi:ABC-2 type transport system permease protein
MVLQTTVSRRAWAAGIGLTVIALTALFSSISGNQALTDALRSYPEAMRKMFDLSAFTSGPGYLKAEVFSFTGPLLLLIPAVLWGAASVGEEESSGTIDLLATAPISRRRIVLEKWAALVVDIAILGAVLTLTLLVGSSAFGLDVAVTHLLSACVATVLLALVFGTLALAVAAATGRTGLGRGVAAAAAVLAYLLSSLADLVDGLRPFRVLSPWYHALGVDPIASGFAPGHLGLLVAAIVVLVAGADARYARRDLGT